jgi:hypothetical protein
MIRVEMEQAASVTLSAESKMEELRSEKDEVVLHARHVCFSFHPQTHAYTKDIVSECMWAKLKLIACFEPSLKRQLTS